MFAKFLVGCLTLAALLIVGGTYVVKSETQMRSRGNFLQKSLRRATGHVDNVGCRMAADAETFRRRVITLPMVTTVERRICRLRGRRRWCLPADDTEDRDEP